jgi:hypothetical protein
MPRSTISRDIIGGLAAAGHVISQLLAGIEQVPFDRAAALESASIWNGAAC